MKNIKKLMQYGAAIFSGLAFISMTIGSPIAFADSTSKLYVSPSSGTYAAGQTFSVELKVNAMTEVNAVAAKLSYPADKLEVTSLSYTNSAFDVQAISTASNGAIDVERGVVTPVKGDKLVGTVTFRAKTSSGTAAVNYTSGASIVNKGEEIPSTKSGGTYSFNGTVANSDNSQSSNANGGNVDVNSGNPGATAKLVVVGDDNKPVKGASVTIDGVTKITDENGVVLFDLSLGQKNAVIKYGDTTTQKTFALGMVTGKDNPAEIKSAIDVKVSRKNIIPYIVIAILLVGVAIAALFIIRKNKSGKNNDIKPIEEDTIIPTASNYARQALDQSPVDNSAENNNKPNNT